MKRMLILARAVAAAFLGHTTPSHRGPAAGDRLADVRRWQRRPDGPPRRSSPRTGCTGPSSSSPGGSERPATSSHGPQIALAPPPATRSAATRSTTSTSPPSPHDEAARQVCDSRVHAHRDGVSTSGTSPTPRAHANADVWGRSSATAATTRAGARRNRLARRPAAAARLRRVPPPPRSLRCARPTRCRRPHRLPDLRKLVTQAQGHGGGWVPLVFHHVCDACDAESVTPDTLSAFLDWLQGQAGNGVSVQTVHDVIGGGEAPPVCGPDRPRRRATCFKPLPRARQNADGVPDCWQSAGRGRTLGARPCDRCPLGDIRRAGHDLDFTCGDRRLLSRQDLGQCAPPATPGHTYTVSACTRGRGDAVRALLSKRPGRVDLLGPVAAPGAGGVLHPRQLHDSAAAERRAGPLAALSLRSTGSVTVDDMNLTDGGPTDSPPVVAITSPVDGATVTDRPDPGGCDGRRPGRAGAVPPRRRGPRLPRGRPDVPVELGLDDCGPGSTCADGDRDRQHRSRHDLGAGACHGVELAAADDVDHGAGGRPAATGTVTIKATAADDGQVAPVRFLLDGVSLGSRVAGQAFQWKWDTSTASPARTR